MFKLYDEPESSNEGGVFQIYDEPDLPYEGACFDVYVYIYIYIYLCINIYIYMYIRGGVLYEAFKRSGLSKATSPTIGVCL